MSDLSREDQDPRARPPDSQTGSPTPSVPYSRRRWELSDSSVLRVTRPVAAIVAIALLADAALDMRKGVQAPEFYLLATVVFLSCMCGWFALAGHVAESRAQMLAGFFGGVIGGIIGAAVGVVGPLRLSPSSNLTGWAVIVLPFYTGPLGGVVGTVIGIALCRYYRR